MIVYFIFCRGKRIGKGDDGPMGRGEGGKGEEGPLVAALLLRIIGGQNGSQSRSVGGQGTFVQADTGEVMGSIHGTHDESQFSTVDGLARFCAFFRMHKHTHFDTRMLHSQCSARAHTHTHTQTDRRTKKANRQTDR